MGGGRGRAFDRLTGANSMEVNWTPPAKEEATETDGAKTLWPVRGPAGRGKGAAVPAWKTRAASAAAPALQDAPGREPGGIARKGRNRVKLGCANEQCKFLIDPEA